MNKPLKYTVEYSMVKTVDGVERGVIEVLIDGQYRICRVGNESEHGYRIDAGTRLAMQLASVQLRDLAMRLEDASIDGVLSTGEDL
jgi:hypothetical protein